VLPPHDIVVVECPAGCDLIGRRSSPVGSRDILVAPVQGTWNLPYGFVAPKNRVREDCVEVAFRSENDFLPSYRQQPPPKQPQTRFFGQEERVLLAQESLATCGKTNDHCQSRMLHDGMLHALGYKVSAATPCWAAFLTLRLADGASDPC
jgi:hypothetical protein